MEQIALVAARNTTVLLTGETGSGKEVAAREIHKASRRRGALVAVNCAGVPAHLLEAEFFGHDRGAFTDASQSRPGLFEKAHEGTLFLDEIGEMPLELQPKLLRVLQDGEVTRLGGAQPRKVDVRLIAATHRDLGEQVRTQAFREDLFYRINVFPIRMPALHERPEDIPTLARHFVALLCRRDGLPEKRIDPGALQALCLRPWPGNVRELRNAVERAVIRSRDEPLLTIADFPAPRKGPERAPSMAAPTGQPPADSIAGLAEMVASYERELIERALAGANGNKAQAAEALRIKRTTLVEKIKRYEREAPAAAGWAAAR